MTTCPIKSNMGKNNIKKLDIVASRVATAGIIAALVLTIVGMTMHSPLMGALALIIVVIAVPFRRPLARLMLRRRP